jgi:Predicted Zn-dependent proteases and their inactivated homologs
MLARPERFFEDRFGLTSSALERLLGSHLAGRVDHADLYLEYRISEELTLEEGAVKKASRHVSQGAGIRAQSGERTGYAHTDDLALPNLEEAARQARAIADQAGASAVVAVGPDALTISTRSPSLPSPPRSMASWRCSGRWTRRRGPWTRGSSR